MVVENIKIIIAEGPHDTSFIARIMRANGYKDPKIKIKEIKPQFLQEHIISLMGQVDVNHGLDGNRQKPMPSHILRPKGEDANELAILFPAFGLNHVENIESILQEIVNLKKNAMLKRSLESVKNIKVIFNIDADDKGVDDRLNIINEWIKKLTNQNFPGLNNFSSVTHNEIIWGAFISADETGFGALEELVLPLFEGNRPRMKAEIGDFVNKEKSNPEVPQPKKYNERKAKIGVMGQFDMSGFSNSVLIDQSKYIDDNVLHTGIYQKIGNFISKL